MEVGFRLRSLAARTGITRARVLLGQATSQRRILPAWIAVGAQRSGLNSVYAYLNCHPLIARSIVEEIHYFDNNYARGMDWYRGHFPTQARAARTLASHGRPQITGESTPYYMAHPVAPQRIAHDLANVKILVALRNPVDRAYSHFNHERALGREPIASFSDALDLEAARLKGEVERLSSDPTYVSFAHQNYSYVERGHYADQIERLFKFFPREQILVISAERLEANPSTVYAEMIAFLGLPAHKVNRFPRIQKPSYPPMAVQVRERLQNLFDPENQRLFRLLGTDFDWGDTAARPR